jgi:hypothetical protein
MYRDFIVKKIREGLTKEITCKKCGWSWNKSETTPSDMYICHKCGKDNTPDLSESKEQPILFNNWKVPSLQQLKLEYKVEHELKNKDFFDSEEEFLSSIQNGSIVSLNKYDDYDIDYRSGTTSKEELLSLIKGYRSYPKFRNEKTLEGLYNGFQTNSPMDLPIVLEFKNGKRRIFSGNTRLDVAFQLGITPKVLLVKINR